MTGNGLITCLWFDGQAEEAANFYTSIFTNSRLGRVTRTNEAGPGPAGEVLTVEFELNGQPFVGLNGGPQYTFTPAISFQIPCADQDELDHYWDRLSADGKEVACGWVTDRYGVSWQVIPTVLPELVSDPDPEKAKRATEAMLSMTKLDIAALRKAHAGA
ncbi:putative 3-demethylubiquinone-9 3-methyltransferase (glyoxalase superfamily) [Lipingzhangella halophila]|uniref:Putative 3-demethylubiquinone-9 3-methyltransferase (Glyoxalase superfamily) n=1 Tax=Lipingzhangella halophila TaxID=1783352 RepID=A0A7W7RGB6_9ACTN|nr:VOC family protein [Lipingzhangella halophila]MBB4931450.1 putative 3-demethylubiquinone-9 3-methyltransferase (glyoxalase superfamily) [Lipingzhangella halophila]